MHSMQSLLYSLDRRQWTAHSILDARYSISKSYEYSGCYYSTGIFFDFVAFNQISVSRKALPCYIYGTLE